MLISLAWGSLVSRRKSVILTFISLVISITVLLSVEHIRLQAKDSFNRTISGVDLIVGAPSGQLNLLLYSVFRMGSPTNNISYDSFIMLQNNPLVEWAIPISLGDSHRGFRVMGTGSSYFAHYQYGNKHRLDFSQGKEFGGLFEAVVGYDVARQLQYKVGDKVVIAHGIGNTSFSNHDNAPFVISGILAPTGTPVDKTVHVSLPAIEAIHLPASKLKKLLQDGETTSLKPDSITGVMLGLKSKFATFTLQRELNNYKHDRLMAILPGVAMTELWQMMATVENLLRAISVLVLISSLFGLSTMLLASMQQRQREIAVLRVLGSGPNFLFFLVLVEALIIVLLSMFAAVVIVSLILTSMSDWLASSYGLFLDGNLFNWQLLEVAMIIVTASVVTSIIPAFDAYRTALHSSLSVK
ncbi:MAG: ABC transporter permease [Aestuariibacter sp.]